MSNKGYVVVDSKLNVAFVLLGQCGEVDAHAWHIDALARPQRSIILNVADELVGLFMVNANAKITIVDKNLCALVNVGHKAWVANGNDIASRLLLRTSYYGYDIALMIFNGLFGLGSTNFWAFCVDKYGKVA